MAVPDVIVFIREACDVEGTVNCVCAVGKDLVLKEVSDLELLCDSCGVVVLVSNVPPLTVEEELFLCGNVDVEPDLVLTVSFDEEGELDSV